jgi:transposase
MSLRIQDSYTVPEKTAEVAQAVFPKGNTSLTLFDAFGSLFADPNFAALFPDNGQPALSPVQLMLTLVLQFMEGLSDRQAAAAICRGAPIADRLEVPLVPGINRSGV